MAADPTARLLTAVRRAQAKRDVASKMADAARAEYRRCIVAALDGKVSQSQLARELRTSPSRIREDAMRGRVESTTGGKG